MRKLGRMGKLKRLCKAKGTSITKLAKVTGIPLSSLTQLWDDDPPEMPLKYAEKLRKVLQLSHAEWDAIVGVEWEPTAENLVALTTDRRYKKNQQPRAESPAKKEAKK